MSLKDRYFVVGDYGSTSPKARLFVDIGVALLIMIMALMFWPLQVVTTGHRGVITEFGKIGAIKDEGLQLVLPWQKLNVFNVRSETASIDNAEGSTSDTQPVKVSMTVRYSILPNKVGMVFEQFSKDGNLDSYVGTATQEVFKAVTARYTAPDLIAKRSDVSTAIFTALNTKLAQYGAQVLNIDMRNFAFSDTYMAAVNKKATEEQLRQAAENKVKTVEAAEREKVVVAEANAAAAHAEADGDAYAVITRAKAEAEAMRLQNVALRENKDVLELRKIENERIKADKWNGQLPAQHVYGGAPIPFIKFDGK